jgi:hypothetical protein
MLCKRSELAEYGHVAHSSESDRVVSQSAAAACCLAEHGRQWWRQHTTRPLGARSGRARSRQHTRVLDSQPGQAVHRTQLLPEPGGQSQEAHAAPQPGQQCRSADSVTRRC